MKITLNSYNYNKFGYKNSSSNVSKYSQPEYKSVEPKFFSYRDYNLSFGARLNRTPEEFYAQKFNIDNMPDTVKKYLYSDFSEHQHMPPAQLQREAYSYLSIADNVDDVKEMYPDEPLFSKLRPFSQTRATRGTLFYLRWDAMTSNTPIFKDKNEKDLTVYFLKKVYLEGKTLNEINKDFENDSTDAIKRELGIKNGQYFSGHDLRSLGIRYPNLSYYNSFLATRNDKEYIPVKRTVDKTNTSGKVPQQDVDLQKKEVSEETREKLSEAKKRWWSQLSNQERDEQIQRMMEGKEFSNSIYSKYQGPIMTIAAAKIGFSERLISIFAENDSALDVNSDFDSFAQKQRDIMLQFWNKDPNFKKVYADAIKTTIQDFEKASIAPEKSGRLLKLLKRAVVLKQSVIQKAKIRRIEKQKAKEAEVEKQQKTASVFTYTPVSVTPKESKDDIYSVKYINKTFKKLLSDRTSFYPDMLRVPLTEYFLNNMSFQDKKLYVGLNSKSPQDYFGCSTDEVEKLQKELELKLDSLNKKFDDSHRLLANNSDFIMAKVLYEITNDSASFKFIRRDLEMCIDNKLLLSFYRDHKTKMNQEMKQMCTPLQDKEAISFMDNEFLEYLRCLVVADQFGNFETKNKNMSVRFIKAAAIMLKHDTDLRAKTIDFLKKQKAIVKFLQSANSDGDPYHVVMQRIITDYYTTIGKTFMKQS